MTPAAAAAAVPWAKRLQVFNQERATLVDQIDTRWIAGARTVVPLDRDIVHERACRIYTALGQKAPKKFLWFDSPLAAQLALISLAEAGANFGSGSINCRFHGQIHVDLISAAHRQFIAQLQHRWRRIQGVVENNARMIEQAVVDIANREVPCAQIAEEFPGPWNHALQTTASYSARARAPQDLFAPEFGFPRQGGYVYLADVLTELGAALPGLGAPSLTGSANWWWTLDDAVSFVDRPTQLHLDNNGAAHNPDGPAVVYRDGFRTYAWHGTQVPADLIENGWGTEQILHEPNVEIRRAAVERLGWEVFLAPFEPKASAADPGNPGQMLDLYELPPQLRFSNWRVVPQRQILLCTNGSIERDGTRRRYGLLVSADHNDPVAAAAELYGIPVDVYRNLEVRT